jgi:hypothetical protein
LNDSLRQKGTLNGMNLGCQILTSLNREIFSGVNQQLFIIFLPLRLHLYFVDLFSDSFHAILVKVENVDWRSFKSLVNQKRQGIKTRIKNSSKKIEPPENGDERWREQLFTDFFLRTDET